MESFLCRLQRPAEFVPNRRNIYVGSRKNKNTFTGLMDEVKLSVVEQTCPGFDLTDDCAINLHDFSIVAADWMKCTDPQGIGCVDL